MSEGKIRSVLISEYFLWSCSSASHTSKQ